MGKLVELPSRYLEAVVVKIKIDSLKRGGERDRS